MKKKLRSAFDPRQYMLSRDFEVYYYADKSFKSVGQHSHDYYEFYFFLEGDVEMDVEGRKYALKPGDILVVPPGKRHRADVLGESAYRRFVLWLGKDYIAKLRAESEDYLWFVNRIEKNGEYRFNPGDVGFNALTSRLIALLEEVHSDFFGRDAAISLAIEDIMLHLNRLAYDKLSHRASRESESRYTAITRFIDNHIDEELSLERLSREFYISKYYIAHLFQKETGISVHRYILKKRLSICEDAMRAGESPTRACAIAGFRDYTSFFRAFKKEYGVSPSEFFQNGN